MGAVLPVATDLTLPLWAALVTAIALVIRWPLRRFGFWLQRRGTTLERHRHPD
jgi:hypothetical protein